MDWDEYFLNIAEAVAKKSKDPRTQVGAVVVGLNHEIRSTGWNGFPRGVLDLPERYENREQKLLLVTHAEANAICNATRCGTSLQNCTLYLTPLPPCHECSKLIIQCGITRVVFKLRKFDENWLKKWEISKLMFDEAGVEVSIIY